MSGLLLALSGLAFPTSSAFRITIIATAMNLPMGICTPTARLLLHGNPLEPVVGLTLSRPILPTRIRKMSGR